MDIQAYFRDSLRALAFLSRLPLPGRVFAGRHSSLAQQAATFPVAGLLLAMPSALLFALLLAADCNALLSGFLAIMVLVGVTGALHEDGLADCADGFGGGRDIEQRLEIMKDSRVGSYGVIALVLSLGLRATALAAIAAAGSSLLAALAVLVTAAASRAAMVWHWHALPSARPAGTGVAANAGAPDHEAMLAAIAAAALISIVSLLIGLPFHALLAGLVCATALTVVFTAQARRLIGGHSGDTIGACQQLAEVSALVGLALML